MHSLSLNAPHLIFIFVANLASPWKHPGLTRVTEQHATPSMSQTQKISRFTRLLCQCGRGALSAINESDNADVIVNAGFQPRHCVVSY